MAQNVTIAIALAALVVLGGCSGLFATDRSPEASPTSEAPRSYDQAVENHTEALKEVGQFKIRKQRLEEFPDQVGNQSPYTQEFVADMESGQFLVGDELEGHNAVYQSGTWYQSGSTAWQRVKLDNGSTVYQQIPPDHQFTARNYTLQEVRLMKVYSKQFPLERNGTAIFQGQRVTRYTADELGPNERCLTALSEDVENVTSVSVVALVDDRGIIRKFECQVSGETNLGERIEQRLVWTVTMVGVVEIREPHPLVNETQGG